MPERLPSEQSDHGVVLTNGLPVGVRVESEGIEFNVGWGPENTDIEIAVEYPDYSDWGEKTREREVTLSREQWEAIVAHIAAELAERTQG